MPEKKLYSTMTLFENELELIIDALNCYEDQIQEQQERHEIALSTAADKKFWIHGLIRDAEKGLGEIRCTIVPVHIVGQT